MSELYFTLRKWAEYSSVSPWDLGRDLLSTQSLHEIGLQTDMGSYTYAYICTSRMNICFLSLCFHGLSVESRQWSPKCRTSDKGIFFFFKERDCTHERQRERETKNLKQAPMQGWISQP